MGWEPASIIEIVGTKLTAYGATVTNYGDYHDITMSESGTAGYKKYSDIIASIGQSYKLRQENTYSPGESLTYVEVWRSGKFRIENSILNPYFDRYDGSGRPVFGCSYNVRLFYEDIVIGSAGGGGSYHMSNPSATVDDVNCPDHLGFGFIIDRSRSIGQVLGYTHNRYDSPYFWSQRTSTTPTSKYATVYNIIIDHMLDYQAVNYITGNGNTYNLSKILTINYGDPVSNAAASSVNLLTASRLDNMIASN